jgi:hypothetical protein
MINQKHGVPRIEGGAAFTTRRSAFLDGTVACFFGPGQSPDAVIAGPFDAVRRPTDWPAAGTLLRMPQVVWLSAVVNPVFYQSEFFGTAPAEDLRIDYPPEPPDFFPFHTVPNRHLIDFRAWQATLLEVKATLDALRPGRTWAHVVDWSSWLPDPGDADTPPFRPFAGVGGSDAFAFRYLPGDETFLHLKAPHAGTGPFLGTDFLHLYAGHFAADNGSSRQFTRFFATSWPVSTDEYLASRANLVANAARFRRFAAHAYGYTQTWEQYPPSPVGDDFASPDGEGTFNDFITRTNFDHGQDPLDSNDTLVATCEDLAAALEGTTADVQYRGLWDGVTADDVVAAIADHFGFDPDTGADLG